VSTSPIAAEYSDALACLQSFVADTSMVARTGQLADELARTFTRAGKVLICGNGGSLCDAAHFAEELTGRFRKDRPPLAAVALSDPGHITCTANDYGFEHIFSRAIEALGRPGDVLIAMSTSGDSANIVRAVDQAEKSGLFVATLLGKTGGRLKGRANLEFIVPGQTADRIQELHMLILHTLVASVERKLWGPRG
jgi:D-sedoheptulose 7-phosphate isomerase